MDSNSVKTAAPNKILLPETTSTMVDRRLISSVDRSALSMGDDIGSSMCSLKTRVANRLSNMTSREMSVRDVGCQAHAQAPTSQDIWLRDIESNELLPSDEESTMRSFLCSLPTPSNNYSRPSMTAEPDVDTRDTPPAVEPIHIVGSLEDLPPARSTPAERRPAPVTPRKPRLTLSAFRRPEETVRLTDCDSSRSLENEYNLRAAECRIIGHGAFSTVRLALRYSDGRKVAIKSISKFDALRARRLRRGGPRHMDEWEIMRLLENNPYVLTLLDIFETDEKIHLVTEYCEGGELFDAIKRKGSRLNSFRRGRYSEAQAARITHQILMALVDVHALGITHRDIKPENVLLLNDDESDIQVKLCDFGVARLHKEMSEPSSDGESSPSTPGLAYTTNSPPEIGTNGACGPAADVYSLGVTLYILLCGFPPVFCDDAIVFPDAYWQDISDEAKSIIRSMLHADPSQRIKVKEALRNPWIRQQTTRVRRCSISANLELVRARLYKTMGDVQPNKRRRGSLTTLSPKKQRRLSTQLAISLTDLYTVSEKADVRVIEECIGIRPDGKDLSAKLDSEKVAC